MKRNQVRFAIYFANFCLLQVIKIESEAVGSTFSKASFTSNDANNDIDLNDPNFWEKWAQKANVDYGQALKDDRILEAPRQRRQTRRLEKQARI